MSFFSNQFSIKKTKPRKFVSRSPLKLPADEMYRELGPKYEAIDVKIADRKIIFDIEHGDWNTAGAESVGGIASSGSAKKLGKDITVLQEENNMLKLKNEVLLNLVAESVAELSSPEK
ncbi:unnamed protein product [Adineta steineri]|uniref:Chibby-like protein n=1 Tax=Adineta steineri TaxID=433720 RepID=A0A818NQS5_9BILA|nr:unnamed protein product [Adineta steineri]CAF1225117.1 unnamed protein product [Adineta steineri]CAF1262478.1 unnamed protein product [Adineta steineri]CAF1327200.1 unnamed protein product [Adineta steineri]CAF1515910.1 unnamed protein product [Adineta steineri]